MKKFLVSALMATALFSMPVFANVQATPDIIKTSYGEFDASGQLLSANETALKKMNFKTVEKQAKKGNANAQFYLAKMYDFGIHTTKDKQQALKWYQKSAENGNALAMNNYANALLINDPKSDVALSWLKKASDLNQPHATMNLALYYIENQESDKGEKMLFELANNGFAPAYYILSDYFGDNIIQDKNSDEPTKEQVYFDRNIFLIKSAENGYAPAQMALSDYYQINYVMNVDKSVRPFGAGQAYKWAKRACINGVERGCQIEQYYAPYKMQDLIQYQANCQKGDEKACEEYQFYKHLVDEMNKGE